MGSERALKKPLTFSLGSLILDSRRHPASFDWRGPGRFRSKMSCVGCGRGFHAECLLGCEVCHPAETGTEQKADSGQPKRELKDEKSTGRKRAARLYPIQPGEPCEWLGLKNCGGGRRPIIGCYDGKQQHRHHGPVKKTTRNQEGNVHRICTPCHVHWHELNDLIYDELDYGLLPHEPIKATDEEVITNQLEWSSGIMGKKFELASSKNTEKFKKKIQEEEEDVSQLAE